jgi:hypothetical protein
MEGTTHCPRPGSSGFLLKLRMRYRTMPRRIDSCINDQIDAAFRLFLLLVNGRRRNRQLGSARWEALNRFLGEVWVNERG